MVKFTTDNNFIRKCPECKNSEYTVAMRGVISGPIRNGHLVRRETEVIENDAWATCLKCNHEFDPILT